MNRYLFAPRHTDEICTPSRCGSRLLVNEAFGQVALSQYAIGHDIDMLRMQGQFAQPVRILADQVERPPIISIMIFLEGCLGLSMQGYQEELIARKGSVGLFYSPDHEGHMDYDESNSDFLAVRMSLTRFREIMQQDTRANVHRLFAPVLKQDNQPFRLLCQQNTEITRLVRDLINPSGTLTNGLIRDARCNELFFYVVEEMIRAHAGTEQIQIPARDRQKLLDARHILVDQLENPPSLVDLAQQVGLNDFKLKKGFRALFDNTVYGVVQEARMEKARHLLLQQNLSITEVSLLVGYSNHGHFSAAFKKRFGMTPRDFSRQHR